MKKSGFGPYATPPKRLRFFETMVRDQEDGGSNPLAPTISLETSNLQHTEKPKTSMVVSETVRLSCVKTSSTNENAVATAADEKRATRIEFASVPDDSTGGAVPKKSRA